MANFDENTDIIEQEDVAAMPLAIRYGGIAALAFIAIQLILDTVGLIDYSTGKGIYYPSILLTISTLVILYFAIKEHRDEELGGFITFGRCVKLGALIGLFSGILIGIFAYIYHGFIRPDIIPSMLEFQISQWEEAGMSEEQIEQTKGMTEMFMTPVATAISSIFNGVFWNVLLSLIVGAIMKKVRPMV